ncbi:MAG: glycerophosphodiester phosphodiesterase [Gemmatimonadota bacterium]
MFPWLRPRPGRTYLAGAPLLVAHRGGSRLAPENTLTAFRQALELWGADMLELDVRCTRDGRVVVIHDETVDRTTQGRGRVADFDWAELRDLDAGYRFTDPAGEHAYRGRGVRIPLFEEILESFGDVRLNVEAKEPGAAEPMVEMVRRHGAEHRVLLAAEHEASRREVRGYPGPWGASRPQIFRFWISSRLPRGGPYVPRADILQVPETWRGRRIVSPGFVAAAHRRNIPVQVWTVDDPHDMRRLLSWGVDGIQTDRPDILARILHEEVGRPLPPGLAKETSA